MAAQEDWSNTATFTTGCCAYDVFLNFRGEDTRHNFTGFLNLFIKDRGIDVFMDSKRLWVGDAIGPALLRSIEGSKISIPVFSKGYADSKWCLLELAQIFECYKSNGQLVLPIFFHVDPSHIRHQTGSFEKAFREHEENFEPHVVQSWRDALQGIGSLKGEVIHENSDQAEIVELVARRVQDELVSSTYLAECKYPIGIASRVEDLLSLLSIGSNDVRFIGICGQSGIGKTTMAKAIYNQILSAFNRLSFISDVNKQANQFMGFVSLQRRLLKDLFNTEFDIGHLHRGKKLIAERLCKENVLLVLDDVDSYEQLDALAGELKWFGEGSRVIITTKDEHILKVANIHKDQIYYPQQLDHRESLELFSLHAFLKHEPPPDYVQLSHDVVRYSRGLPSTLERLGSYLLDIRSKEEWKITLRKLKAGKASIFRLASLRRQRKSTCSIKDNPLGWHQQLHGTTESSNPVASVSKVLGGFLDLYRVCKRKVHAARFRLNAGYSDPYSSTFTYGFLAIDGVGKSKFTMAEIGVATNNFNESLVIGVGGFGKVYKGVLKDGTVAAFKCHSCNSRQGLKEFESEIMFLSNVRHKNLVVLMGFCYEKDEMILVYEYIGNGTLKNHLYGRGLPPLTWKQRLEICIGVAQGLHFLHTGSERGIIHRDVKTSNILLDEDFVAKLIDFGVASTGPASQETTYVSTQVMGTYGYFDPEYLRNGQLTTRSDVYSFGVVLLEVVCARPVINIELPPDEVNLAGWAHCQWEKQGSLENIVDKMLEGTYDPKSLEKFEVMAKKCTANRSLERPTMAEVVQGLDYMLHLHEAWLRNSNAEEDYATFCSTSNLTGVRDSRVETESLLVRCDDCSRGEQNCTCFSLVDTIGSEDSRAQIESALGRNHDSMAEGDGTQLQMEEKEPLGISGGEKSLDLVPASDLGDGILRKTHAAIVGRVEPNIDLLSEPIQAAESRRVVIPQREYELQCDKFKFALTGRVNFHLVSLDALHAEATCSWAIRDGVVMHPIGKGYVVFEFKMEEHMTKVWRRSPWRVGSQVIWLHKWRPDFNVDTSEPAAKLMWIRFPGLPLEYWHEKVLLSIAKSVGHPVDLDRRTRQGIMGYFARVLVEVNVGVEKVEEIQVERCETGSSKVFSFLQKVEYEEGIRHCGFCKKDGHLIAQCRFRKREEQQLSKEVAGGSILGAMFPGNELVTVGDQEESGASMTSLTKD